MPAISVSLKTRMRTEAENKSQRHERGGTAAGHQG